MAETEFTKYIIKRPKASVPIQKKEFSWLSIYIDKEVIPGAYYFLG